MKNPQEASRLLFKLEDLLRYQIGCGSQENVPLSEDIRFLGDYLNLEKVRRDRFDFSIRVEGDTEGIVLSPMLFIPFVENAVKHNTDCEHPSYVRLAFRVKGNGLDFQCINSKPAETSSPRHLVASSPKEAGGIGLKNIVRRLELLYPDRHTLRMEESETEYIVNLWLSL